MFKIKTIFFKFQNKNISDAFHIIKNNDYNNFIMKNNIKTLKTIILYQQNTINFLNFIQIFRLILSIWGLKLSFKLKIATF